MSKRVLITGITGFVGSHLAEYLLNLNNNNNLNQEFEVYGTARWRSKLDNIKHIRKLTEDKTKLLYVDMRDSHSVSTAIWDTEPDYIFHLAAQSYVPMSWAAPADTMETNVIGTVHLLEAVRQSKQNPIIHLACSSEEYGLVYPNELPIKETNPLRPLSPYGISKVAEDLLGQQYNKSYGLKTVITRAFNHTGPRRGDVFVTSNFAKQIVEIEKKVNDTNIIQTGNLDASRDFTDVRDIIEAYWLSVSSPKIKYGEQYNICSGNSIKISHVLNTLINLTDKNIKIEQNINRMRPSDVEILQGDFSKFKEATNWKPKIPFKKTMEDLLNYWRNVIVL